MAMNKAEQAEMEGLKTKLALRLTDKVEKDQPVPSSGDEIRGFAIIGTLSSSLRVEHCLSGAHGHSISHVMPVKTNCQMGISSYSTRLIALRACRNEIEIQAAKALRYIDTQIEAELARAGEV